MVLFAAACVVTEPADLDPTTPEGLPTGEVTRVVDGDTIEVQLESGTTTVRLLGINAPDEGECFAEEATDYLIQHLKGSLVTLEQEGVDQFGRHLAYVWRGDQVFNLRMVSRGLAIATTPNEPGPLGASFLVSEQAAFEIGAGLWEETVCGASGDRPDVDLDTRGFNPPGPDDEGLAGEFVSLSNSWHQRVDLSGWTLRDESSTHRYRFREGTGLEPGDTVQLTSADPGWEPGDQPVWNNGGDMALLLDEHGRVVARRRYP